MDPFDLAVRRHVYASIVDEGRPPTTEETASFASASEPEVAAAYGRLHDAHALVLSPGSTDIWMASPFCFAETPHRVEAGGREWTAACSWDAFGIPAALHADGEIATVCACCGEALRIAVQDGRVSEGGDLLCHVLVPARRWWDDIGFT